MKINKLENRILFTNIIITFKSTLVDSCRALHAKQIVFFVVCVYWCDDVPVLATGQWERARVKLSGHQ